MDLKQKFLKSDSTRIRFIELFDDLNIPKDKTIIVGSALLVAMGYIDANNDIDAIASPDVIAMLKKTTSLIATPMGDYDLLTSANDELEIAYKFGPMDWQYQDIDNHTIEIDGYRFLNPSKLLEFYHQIDRPKDKIKIEILETMVNQNNTLERHFMKQYKTDVMEQCKQFGIESDIGKRWEEGIEHHPNAEEIFDLISTADWIFGDDYFGWKKGGDGDNGETLMYTVSVYLEYLDKIKKKGEKR